MAEVRKKDKVEKYNIDEIKVPSKKKMKVKKDANIKLNVKKSSKGENKNKKNLWQRFMIFCSGVKGEVTRVHWTSKNDMIKYSIATIIFIIFCAVFFYLIDIIFALVQSLFN